MKDSRWKAFLTEFPWLVFYVKEKPQSVRVEIIDLDFCLREPEVFQLDFGWEEKEIFILLDSSGKKIEIVGEFSRTIILPPKPKRWWRPNPQPRQVQEVCQTVGEVMVCLPEDDADRVYFVLELAESIFPSREQVVIHKGRKGQNIKTTLGGELERSGQELREEIESLG